MLMRRGIKHMRRQRHIAQRFGRTGRARLRIEVAEAGVYERVPALERWLVWTHQKGGVYLHLLHLQYHPARQAPRW